MQRKMRRAWKRAEEKKNRRQVKPNQSFLWRETLIRTMMPPALAAALMMSTMSGVVMAQQVVTDGKTQTQVSANGNVTDITTSTISGQNSYNSFSYFNLDGGNIANFYLPGNTSNLLNVVTNSVRIDGMVNSIKNGNIGGNMYFITPGFVVGESGVLNVGSLKVVTPTQDYINNFFVTPGVPSETATAAVLNGQIPLDSHGYITVQGKINAIGNIHLAGGDVTNSGALTTGAVFAAARPDMSDVVNLNGAENGAKIATVNGDIEIVAANNFENSGTIAADGADNLKAGNISVTAGNNVTLDSGSKLSARGYGENSSGGNIRVYAANEATFNQDAVIDVRGGEISGDGGFAEFSAARTVTLGGGVFQAGAVFGKAGTALVDPEELKITGNITPATASSDGIAWSAGNLTLTADKSINIGSGVTVSTRVISVGGDLLTAYSTGDSGALSLTAPSITISDNAKILTQAINSDFTSYKAGDITLSGKVITLNHGSQLLASDSKGVNGGTIKLEAKDEAASGYFGAKSATATIQIGDADGGATLNGGNIDIHAVAIAENGIILPDTVNPESTLEIATTVLADVPTMLSDFTGSNVIYSKAHTDASIIVKQGSLLNAADTVKLKAETLTEAGSKPFDLPIVNFYVKRDAPGAVGVLYADLGSHSTITVEDGTKITSKNLSIAAHNDAAMNAAMAAQPPAADGSTKVSLAVGITVSDVSATVNVGGALNVADSIQITATNKGSYESEVTALSGKNGVAAGAVGLSFRNSGATANLTANVNDAGNVGVYAVNDLAQDTLSVSTKSGTGTLSDIANKLETNVTDALQGPIYKLLGLDKLSPSTKVTDSAQEQKFRVSGAIAYADHTDTATATIGGGATIHATGSVAAASLVNAQNTNIAATAAAVSNSVDDPTAGNPSKQSYAVSLAYGNLHRNSLATVGPNVTVTAANIGISSKTSTPLRNLDVFTGKTFDEWSSVTNFMGVVDNLLTSAEGVTALLDMFNGQAASKAVSDESKGSANIAGSVGIFNFDNTSQAIVDSGAKLNLTGTATGKWSTDAVTLTDGSAAKTIKIGEATFTYKNAVDPETLTFNFEKQAQVKAENDNTLLFLGGPVIPSSSGATGLGGSFNMVTVNSDVNAIVREGAVIQRVTQSNDGAAAGSRTWTTSGTGRASEFEVNSQNLDKVVSLVATSGYGATYGVNGTVAVTYVNQQSYAWIDDEATVKTNDLTVNATATPLVWSIAGHASLGKGANVGLGVAVNEINDDTRAEIADNDQVSTDGTDRVSQLTIAQYDPQTQSGVLILAPVIDVAGHTGGNIASYSVTGSVVNYTDDKSPGFLDKLKKPYKDLTDWAAKLVGLNRDNIAKSGQTVEKPADPKFGLSGAGSGSANIVSQQNTAKVDHVYIDQSKPASITDPSSLRVMGTSSPTIIAGSGAAAITRVNSSSEKVKAGVSGSVALNQVGNGNSAILSNSTVVDANDLDVQALSSGDRVSVAIGAEVDASSGSTADYAAALAGSVSLTLDQKDAEGKTKNFTNALVEKTSITGAAGGAANDVEVTAYNSATVGTGGGSLELQPAKGDATGAGVGAAVTYADVDSDVSSWISGTTITSVNTVGVHAYNASTIGAGGATAALTNDVNTLAFAGTVVISRITDNTTASIEADSALTVANAVTVEAKNKEKDDILEALIEPGGKSIAKGLDYNALGNVPDGNGIVSVAGVVQATKGANVGFSINYSDISDNLTARVADSTVKVTGATGSLDVKTESTANILGIAFGLGISNNSLSGAGSVAVGEINNSSSALVNDAATLTANRVTVDATDNSTIKTIAGQVNLALNQNSAIGAAVTYNEINNTVNAQVNAATIHALSQLTVAGHNTSTINSIAAAGALATGQVAVSGSITINFIENSTTGQVIGNSVIDAGTDADASNTLSVTSNDSSTLQSLAGSLAVSKGKAGAGGAFAYNSIANQNSALIDTSTINDAATLTLTATENATINTLSAAVSGGQNAALSGSVSVSQIGHEFTDNDKADHRTVAKINNSTIEGNTSLDIGASDTSKIHSIAGGAAISTKGVSVGASVAYNNIYGVTEGTVTNSSLKEITGLSIDGFNSSEIQSIAAAGSGGSKGAFAGSSTVNTIGNHTLADITSSSITGSAAGVTITAQNNGKIDALAGAIGVAKNAAFGIAIAVNDIGNETDAYITGSAVGQEYDLGNLLISSQSGGSIATIAAGVAGSGDVGVAGSSAANKMHNNTNAYINGGAKVKATQNVGVLAENDDTVQVGAGAAGIGGTITGVGLSVVVNEMQGETNAYISGAGTQVDTEAQGTVTPLQVNSGQLVTLVNDSISKRDTASAALPDLTEQKKAVTGLAVVATSHQAVATDAVTLGIGKDAGVDLMTVTNLMGGETHAYISEGAAIDNRLTNFTAPEVYVNASSHSYAGNFGIGAAGGEYGAATGIAVANNLQRKTYAEITGATVGVLATHTATEITDSHTSTKYTSTTDTGDFQSGDDNSATTITVDQTEKITKTLKPTVGSITVTAAGSENSANIVTGFAAALGSGAGTGVVNLFKADTKAGVSSDSQVAAGSLKVNAVTDAGYNVITGSGAVGGTGLAGAFVVSVSNNTTRAYVGDDTLKSSMVLSLAGDLTVTAKTTNDFDSLVIGGALGGSTGVAGMADVTVIDNTTKAGLYNVTAGTVVPAATAGVSQTSSVTNTEGTTTTITNTTATTYDNTASGLIGTALGNVTVDAAETIDIDATAGAAGVGGFAGVGAGANVIVIKSGVDSQISGGSLTTPGTLNVTAESTKTIKATTVTAGAGLTAGIGGVASLILIGSGETGDALDELDNGGSGTLTKVNTFSNDTATYNLSEELKNTKTDGVNAGISGATLEANAVTVKATASVAATNLVGAAGIGTDLGVGGAVGYTRVYDNVTASVRQSTVTAPSITVNALLENPTSQDHSAIVTSYAGGVGLVGLGAAVADATIGNTVTAEFGGKATGNGSGNLEISATDKSTVNTDGVGAFAGAGAAGAVISIASKTSAVQAKVNDNAKISQYQKLNLTGDSELPESVEHMVSAKATGAAGGLLAAGFGAQATAVNVTQVYAVTGSNVQLPDGDVTLQATNNSNQWADATGIAGAGLIAASGAVAETKAGTADQAMITEATLGDGTQTATTRTGQLSITAYGVDINQANATAGSGGVIAGNAAIARTNENSNVSASIGSGSDNSGGIMKLYSGSVTIDAQHNYQYSAKADSTNASALGGGGAKADNNATSDVSAQTGNNLLVDTSGKFSLTAANSWVDNSTGNNVAAAGGGVINGNAAASKTDINGTTKANTGNNVTISTGSDGIYIVADNYLSADDQVVLKTGGGIEGAKVDSEINADLTNQVTIGSGNNFWSNGNIDIGSYTRATAATNAYVNTWGVAAVGSAEADTDITNNQSVTITGNSQILAIGNINITAGNDPTGAFNTRIAGDATATGYVRGLIAIPAADADTKLTSNSSLDIQSGVTISSAQNVTLGAYHGSPEASADGTGHGYELGFIPVTDGNSSTATPTSARVTQNGTVTAGMYHDLNITIHNGTITQTSGAPFLSAYNSAFDLQDYISKYYGNNSTLSNGVSSGSVTAVVLGTLFAAGGTITVNADELKGTGTLTSYGSPQIRVNNTGKDYLILGDIEIPDQPGAQVVFTGNAGASQYQGAIHEIGRDAHGDEALSQVIISNSYEGTVGDGRYGPAIFLDGTVKNMGGLVSVSNTSGSIGQTGQIFGQTISISAPKGSIVVSSKSADGYYSVGSDVYSFWKDSMLWPGGNPSSGVPSANWAIAYVANSLVNADGKYTNSYDLTKALIGRNGSESSKYNWTSLVFLGDNVPWGSNLDYVGDKKGNKKLSPVDGAYDITGDDSGWFPEIPVVSLKKVISSYPTPTPSPTEPGLTGLNIDIEAKYIDIRGTIEVGQNTDWSLQLSDSLTSQLNDYRDLYSIGWGSRMRDLDFFTTTINGADTKIKAKYDAKNNQIIVEDNLIAASGGASLVMKGGIISTNTLGKVHVNGGLGTVTIDNQTGVPLELQSINTGNLSAGQTLSSTIEIIDTLKDNSANHWLYSYTPGQGLSVYNGAQNTAVGQLGLISTSAAATATYNPLTGAAWQWKEQASLSREVSYVKEVWTVGNWTWDFPSGHPNDPWQYVTSTGSLSTTPQGHIVKTGRSDLPAFEQTITGSYGNTFTWGIYYGEGNHNFEGNIQKYNGDDRSKWSYAFPRNATLNMTMTAKADNPVSIDFSGNARAAVNITSNAAVLMAGDIVNPNGDLNITTTGSGNGISQSRTAAIRTHDLALTAVAGIGSAAQPLAVTLSGGGTLNLQAGKDGVYVNLDSGATIGKITSGDSTNGFGDMVISADGSLIPLAVPTGGANVTGSNITIDTTMGSVGSLTNPLVISANQNSLANGGTSGGVVNISAQEDIGLTQIAGDLLVDQIKSTADGNILINVPNGNLYNAGGQTAAQALSRSQAEKVWKALGLTEADGAETGKATDATVQKFESLVNWYYNQYWQLRNLGTFGGDGALTLSDAGVALMTPQAAAALDIAAPTAAQVRAYANQLYRSDCNFLSIVAAGGVPNASSARVSSSVTPANLNDISDYTTYNSSFNYTATSGQITALTGNAVWTADELTAAISRSALLPSSGTPVGNTTANITGRDVTIKTGYAVGKLVDPVAISLTDFQNRTLTDEEKAALALAKSPGDVVGVGTNSAGETVTFSFEVVDGRLTVPEGITLTGLQLSQTAPVYVDAAGKIKVSASQNGTTDAVYLQASGISQNLSIDQIKTLGDIYLTAPRNITAAVNNTGEPLSAYQLQGDNIKLISGSGNIGSEGTPVTYEAGGALILATAGQDIYLKNANGDMKIGGVAAGGTAWLESEDGDILSLYSGGVAVQGGNIYLQADSNYNIGSSTNPLTVQLTGDGALSGKAGGSITLAGPSETAALTISDLTAENDISLDGAAAIVVRMLTANNGSITINALKNVTISGTVQTSNSLESVSIYGSTITETGGGLIRASQLTALSGNGQTLIGANAVDAFNAINSNGGDISFNNTASTLTLTGISQTAGGNVTVNNTGAIAVTGTVDITGNVNLTASQAITESGSGKIANAALLTTQSNGGQTLNGANTVNAFNATNSGGGEIQLTNTDDTLALTGINQTAGGNVTVNNTGAIAVTGTVDTTGNVNLKATEVITESGEGRITDAALLTTQSIGGQTLNGANTVNTFNATNAGGGEIQFSNTDDELALTGISQTAGGNVRVNNTGAIAVTGTVDITGNVNLTASQAITESGSGKIANAALLTTQSNGGQTLNGANTVNAFNATNSGGGEIQLTNTDDTLALTGISQTAGGNVTVNNTGAIAVTGTVATKDNVNLTASQVITESGDGRITDVALLTTRSNGGQTLNGANTVNAFNAANGSGGEIELANTDDELDLTGISQAAGGNVTVNNTGAIAVTRTVATTDNVNLKATEVITESGDGRITDVALLTTQSNGGQTLNGANTVNAFAAANDGGGEVQLTNTDDALTIEKILQAADGKDDKNHNVTVNNTGNIYVKTVTAKAGDINLTASESILNRLGNTDVNLDAITINLKAENGQVGEESIRLRVHATDKVNAAAAGDIYIEGCNGALVSYSMTSKNGVVDLITANGKIVIDQVSAQRLSFTLTRPGDTLELDTINVIDSINVKADKVNFGQMNHTGLAPLHLSIGGGSKEMADNVTINAASGFGIIFDKLHTDNGRINAQTDILDFYNTVVGERVEFNNKYYAVLADNHYHGLENFDVQLYPENKPFHLFLESDRLISTNAYIVNYNPDFILNQPDIRNSFVREAEMNLPIMTSAAGGRATDYTLTSRTGNGPESNVIYTPGNLGIGDGNDHDGQFITDQDIHR